MEAALPVRVVVVVVAVAPRAVGVVLPSPPPSAAAAAAAAWSATARRADTDGSVPARASPTPPSMLMMPEGGPLGLAAAVQTTFSGPVPYESTSNLPPHATLLL